MGSGYHHSLRLSIASFSSNMVVCAATDSGLEATGKARVGGMLTLELVE